MTPQRQSKCPKCLTTIEAHKYHVHARTCKVQVNSDISVDQHKSAVHIAALTTYNLTFKGINKSRSTLKGVGAARIMNNLTAEPIHKNSIKDKDIDVINTKPTFMKRPRTFFCYICGREYGTASLQIHVKACIKKFEMEESVKPPHLRRPVP